MFTICPSTDTGVIPASLSFPPVCHSLVHAGRQEEGGCAGEKRFALFGTAIRGLRPVCVLPWVGVLTGKLFSPADRLVGLAQSHEQRTVWHPTDRFVDRKFGKNSKNRIFFVSKPLKKPLLSRSYLAYT